jgi:hypothetical protein
VVLEVVWVLAVLGGLVQDRFELVALVAALGEEAGQIGWREIAVAKVCEELPDLHSDADGSQGRRGGNMGMKAWCGGSKCAGFTFTVSEWL